MNPVLATDASREWTLEGLAAARLLVACSRPLPDIAHALSRGTAEVDRAMWVLLGRSHDEALALLNGVATPREDLPMQLLLQLRGTAQPVETRELAQRLRVSWPVALVALRDLAEADLVDCHEAPAPCGEDALAWFVKGRRFS